MILNIRGTSGSGKSTLAKYVMDHFKRCESIYYAGRRKPIGYDCDGQLFVLGHYEISNGGMDTVDLKLAYEQVREWATRRDVLFEGKTMRDKVTDVIELSTQYPLTVIHLTTPPETAWRRVQKRVGPTGQPHNIAIRSIESMAAKCERDVARLREHGITCHSVSLETAKPLALQTLLRVGRGAS